MARDSRNSGGIGGSIPLELTRGRPGKFGISMPKRKKPTTSSDPAQGSSATVFTGLAAVPSEGTGSTPPPAGKKPRKRPGRTERERSKHSNEGDRFGLGHINWSEEMDQVEAGAAIPVRHHMRNANPPVPGSSRQRRRHAMHANTQGELGAVLTTQAPPGTGNGAPSQPTTTPLASHSQPLPGVDPVPSSSAQPPQPVPPIPSSPASTRPPSRNRRSCPGLNKLQLNRSLVREKEFLMCIFSDIYFILCPYLDRGVCGIVYCSTSG